MQKRYMIFLLALALRVADSYAAGRIEVVGSANVDLGKYPAGDKKIATYKIRNSGDEHLQILQVRKTCGCASATCDKSSLKPGDEANVEITILPYSIFGLYSKNTFVESTDPTHKFLQLTTSGHSIPLVEVKPNHFINAGRIASNQPWAQSFELVGTLPAIELGEPIIQANYSIKASLNPVDGTERPTYRLAVTKPPTGEPGDLRCDIRIPITFPSNHPPVMISIEGKVGYELTAIPELVYLPVSETVTTRQFTLKVLGQRSRILDPKLLAMDRHSGVTFEVKQHSDGKALLLDVQFSSEFTKDVYTEGILPLTFKVPGASSATIVCKTKK